MSRSGPRLSPALPWLLATPLSLLFATRVWCNDLWWHMATGRWIVANGTIPETDPFTFAGIGASWTYVTAVADLLYYAVYSLGGVPGIVCLKVATALLLLGLLGHALRLLGSNVPVLATVMILVAVLVQPRMSMARPLALGGAALAATLLVAALAWHRRVGFFGFLLIPIAALWSGFHASVVLAIPVAAALALAWWLSDRPKSCAIALTVNVVLVVGMLLLLPTGRGAFMSAYDHTTATCLRRMIQEWGAVDWTRGSVVVPMAVAAISMPFLLGNWRDHLLHLLLAAGGLALPLFGGRLAPMAALLLAPSVATGLTLAIERLPVRTGLLGLAGLLVASTAALHIAPNVALDRQFGLGLDPFRYPLETLDTLEKLPEGRVINDFGLGGYLIWRGYQGRVFMDGRTVVVFKEGHCNELLMPLYASVEGPRILSDRFEAPYALAEWNSSLYDRLTRSLEWVPVHHGRRATLFVRSSSGPDLPETVLLQPNLRSLSDEAWMAQWYGGVFASKERTESFEAALLWTARHSPFSMVFPGTLRFLERHYPDYFEQLMPRIRTVLEEVL